MEVVMSIMFSSIDPLILARVQFAFTVSFHILFPAFTIGLASWLAVLEAMWLKTGKTVYKETYLFWVKVFAVSFAMGVVSGLLMSYQFGTNWSAFSRVAGNIIGPLMGYEVLTAFFLEASFLGIMLFGWERVSPRVHFGATIAVAFGTLLSAFWILSANSWMHTPAGYRIESSGVILPTNWLEIIFNPSFPYRFMHMVSAAYLTTAFVVAGVAGYYFFKNAHQSHAKVMMGMAVLLTSILAPLQMWFGDMHGLNTLEYQPVKIAAMEGLWDTKRGAELHLFGIPDEEAEETKYPIVIPYAGSLILTHKIDGEVKGLKAWDRKDRPPVIPVFFGFRIMVGIGMLMAITGLMGAWLYFKGVLFSNRRYHIWSMLMLPSGFVAILAGWMVTEIGRQPYVVYGVMRTANALSPVPGGSILFSLSLLFVVYGIIFGAGLYYIWKLIQKGPIVLKEPEVFGDHGVKEPPTAADAIQSSR